jgi:putative tryptophan/tyrosine transport system substrate-binding protein
MRTLPAILLVCLASSVAGQPSQKVYRIGYVGSTAAGPVTDAFQQGLRDLGYIEGRNAIVDTRFAEGNNERVPHLINELLARKVDVLVVGSTPTALAAKRATTTVPIVFAYLYDPVFTGVVASLARPGGNLTGTAAAVGGSGFAGKYLELLKEAAPHVSHIAVLSNARNPANAQHAPEIQAAARRGGVKVQLFDAGDALTLERGLAAIAASGAQGLIVTPDPSFGLNREKLVQFAEARRLPAVYFSELFIDAGGLMAYGGSQQEAYRRAAAYVDKILKGAKPAELPIEQPTKFELAINLKAARALGLALPQPLLLRADRLIQ